MQHILARHLSTALEIQPRLPGKFESLNSKRTNSFGELAITDESLLHSDSKASDFAKTLNEDSWQRQDKKTDELTGQESLPDLSKVRSENKNLPLKTAIPSKGNSEKPNFVDPFEITPIQINDLKHPDIPGKSGIRSEPDPGERKPQEEMPPSGENNPEFKALHSNLNLTDAVKPQPDRTITGYLNSNDATIYPVRNERQNSSTSSLRGFSNMNQQQETFPVIKVSIGRIEVRAITDSNPVKASRTVLNKPKLSLEDYLNKRNKGE